MEITPKMKQALDYAKEGRTFFITGNAGTGKSTTVNYIIDNINTDNIIKVAPTGIAAVNIGGFTIHSTFGIGAQQEPGVGEKLNRQKREVLERVELLIVDEISMVRIDLMESMDLTLKEIHRNNQFMGGIPTIFVGDLLQLPPVKDRFFDKVQERRKQNGLKKYKSEYMFDYEGRQEADVPVIILDKVFRQTDRALVDCLNKIRDGSFTQETLDYLNEHCAHKDYDHRMIALTTTNKIANMYNTRMINKLKAEGSEMYEFTASISKNGSRPAYAEKEFPVPYFLRLPIGARILITVNDKHGAYVNGTTGEFLGMDGAYMRILKDPVRGQEEGEEILLEKYTWIKQVPRLNEEKKIELLQIGEYKQYPIKYGWAITQHKSQGCTFDHVYVDLGPRSFATGQMYVALSRCTSMEGMCFSREITPRYILTHDYVLSYLKKSQHEKH